MICSDINRERGHKKVYPSFIPDVKQIFNKLSWGKDKGEKVYSLAYSGQRVTYNTVDPWFEVTIGYIFFSGGWEYKSIIEHSRLYS